MAEDIIRNGSGAGHGAKKAEALPPHPPAVAPVPPMEAEWLRVVGGRPGGPGGTHGPEGAGANGGGANPASPNGAGPNGADRNGAAPQAPGLNGRGPKG